MKILEQVTDTFKMLAARDQENLVHARQQTAAGKPLNQGIRALNPKTPSNLKTPFRPARNDENRQAKDGPSKLEKNLFVTPGPQRERAPLGFKTTNAKGQAFKTPAPLQPTAKLHQTLKKPSTARRSAKSKIHIAPEPVKADILSEESEADSEPEYGYAPPPIKELPDPPMDIPYDQTFPQFQGKNMFRGYGEIYCTSPTDENGVSIREKKEQESARIFREERLREADRLAEEAMKPVLPTDEELDAKVDKMISAGPKRATDTRIDTMQSKSAAAFLSEGSSKPKLPAAATKQTAASALKRQAPSTALPLRSRPLQTSRPAPFNVSKNTIGFPKAKAARSIIPQSSKPLQAKSINNPATQKVDQENIHPKEFVRLYGQPPAGSRMSDRLMRHELLEEELRQEEEADGPAPLFEDVDDLLRGYLADEGDDDVFQLEVPE